MIFGPPGSGKSDLALRLIDQAGTASRTAPMAARLVATTRPAWCASATRWWPRRRRRSPGRLEVRGIGILKVRNLPSVSVALAVRLTSAATIDRLPGPDEERVPGARRQRADGDDRRGVRLGAGPGARRARGGGRAGRGGGAVTIEGLSYYPGYLDRGAQAALRDEICEAARPCPAVHAGDAAHGKPFSVRMTNLGPLGWVSDRAGYRYQPLHPAAVAPWPAIRPAFSTLWRGVANYPHPPEACLVNVYRPVRAWGCTATRTRRILRPRGVDLARRYGCVPRRRT